MSAERRVCYSAFGVCFRANKPIPGLVESKAQGASTDVEIYLGSGPPGSSEGASDLRELYYVSSDTDDRGDPSFRIWRTSNKHILRMDYADGVRFWLEQKGTAVWCTWPENLTIADAAVYLLGPILGLLLRLRGVTCLHASAAVFGECAVAFAGPPGAGKSTTAAALGRRGHAIVSDDIVAIEERERSFFVFPAHPYLGLWPESVEMLYGGQKKVPGFASLWEKKRLSLPGHDLSFQERALPLGAIFVLGERTGSPDAPSVAAAGSRTSLMELVGNSYGTNLLEIDMRAREFELLGRLVRQVPVWRLQASVKAEKLPSLCDLIERTCDGLTLGPAHPGA